MPSGVDITRGRYATLLEDTQTRPLGQAIMDNKGQREWTYVQFEDPVNAGDLVRDQVTVDMVTTVSGEIHAAVTTASAIGSKLLIDSSAFDGEDFVGAFGQIVAGAGAGQTFFIQEMDDANQVKIAVLSGVKTLLDLDDDRGWQAALSTTSRYVLRFPGSVVLGEAQSTTIQNFPRGWAQQTVLTADTGKFGYVCSKGLCFANILLTDADLPVAGEGMIPLASGRIQGFTTGGTTADDASRVVAICQHGDITLSPDTGEGLILVEAKIDDSTMAFRLTDESDPRIRTHIE